MGQRSHWAWGDEDQLPDDAERALLRQQLSGVFGWSLPAPLPYPTLDSARLPTPRLAIPQILSAFCVADDRARARRTYGRAFPDLLRGFQGDFSAAPDFIALPSDEAEITAVLSWAAEVGAAVVPYGGGTSVVGGVECRGEGYCGVVCLDLSRLDRVLEIDETSLQARIQAGTMGPALEAQLAERGLSLRHFPQSFTHSTLGGWLATRAGGHFATRYTHIDDLVSSIRMLTAQGVWESRRLPGSGAGPSPDRLVLGSEGTLGVITEAWMRVFPRPQHRSKATIHFDDFSAAVAATRAIAQAR
ncbi:MAG: alkyldihydroxyacetonephosphate synthase, partial [Myxococcota bacterium]